MTGLKRLARLVPDRSAATYWRWLEWVGFLVPVAIFLAYYFLMVGPAHELLHSVYGILILVALIVLFSRLMFDAIGRLQRSNQTLSQQVSGQNIQLRQLHEANLALSQERVTAAVMQRVADLGCQLFQARSAMLTVVGPHWPDRRRQDPLQGPRPFGGQPVGDASGTRQRHLHGDAGPAHLPEPCVHHRRSGHRIAAHGDQGFGV